jgi:peptide/nickel transport system substrate-binding protein
VKMKLDMRKTIARRRLGRGHSVTAVLVAAALTMASFFGVATSASAATTAHQGGSLTVLEETAVSGAWPTGLDAGTDNSGVTNETYMDAIYGQLFDLGANGKTIPDLATGYQFLNGGKTLAIDIRPGVTFSDGTPFNAAAVQYNMKRDLSLPCSCKPTSIPVTTITTSGPDTVDINMSAPYGAAVDALQGKNFNWIVSPTALAKMGEKQFLLTPVGAGPFEVVSDTLSTSLVLKRNPTYWQKGLPYLDNLTFKSVASDEAAYEAMEAGQGQAYEAMQTPQLVKTFSQHFTTTAESSLSPGLIQLNTAVAPFNNIVAREAVYYATDAAVLNQKLFGSSEVSEGFTAPGGLFYEATVPGYRSYDLAKAKALVKQLGGLSVSLAATQSAVSQTLIEGVQEMWEQAGIKVTIHDDPLTTVIQEFDSKTWQAFFQSAGGFDPAGGLGVYARFGSTSPFSGVHDPKLDALFAAAAATDNPATRQSVYNQAEKYISDQAYGVFLFPSYGWNIADKGVTGPGLTTELPASAIRPVVFWQDVSVSS